MRAGRAGAKTAVRVSYGQRGAYPPPDPWPPQRGDCCGQRRGPCGPLAECEAKRRKGIASIPPDLTAVMSGWPENKIVRRVRLMVVHNRRNHPCRISLKR